MASVRQSGTSAELIIRNLLRELDIKFEMNPSGMPGRPDLVNKEDKWVIFVNGCFWHAHEGCNRWTIPKNNHAFWEKKFLDNKKRDKKNIDQLKKLGYSVLVVWECEQENIEDLKRKMKYFFMESFEEYYYSSSLSCVNRTIFGRDGRKITTRLNLYNSNLGDYDPKSAFDFSYLRMQDLPNQNRCDDIIYAVDLFCGCGGLSLGTKEACRALGIKFLPTLALDIDPIALSVYKNNFQCDNILKCDINDVIDGSIGNDPSINEKELLNKLPKVDILLAGPPCKGYSDLNNYTRRNDPRNALYIRVGRFIELFKPNNIIIENVPTVIHGKNNEVKKTIELMTDLGYYVDSGIIDLTKIGVPQKRKRHALIASTTKYVNIKKTIKKYSYTKEHSIRWAINDIEKETYTNVFKMPTKHTEVNYDRIRYLHENNIYDLPDFLRPDCHKKGNHSYKSMYGRMKYDEPAQTITGGFTSPGQGRFVHPTQYRTITPHEAARLQFFPDFFDWSSVKKRTALAEMIGNAVPMKLSYIFSIELLG
jgi:DNA (cytosine-5)-methyltransferase 1